MIIVLTSSSSKKDNLLLINVSSFRSTQQTYCGCFISTVYLNIEMFMLLCDQKFKIIFTPWLTKCCGQELFVETMQNCFIFPCMLQLLLCKAPLHCTFFGLAPDNVEVKTKPLPNSFGSAVQNKETHWTQNDIIKAGHDVTQILLPQELTDKGGSFKDLHRFETQDTDC